MSIHFVKGDDPILRGDVLDALVTALVGDDDRSLAVEDITVPARATEGEGGEEARTAAVAAAVNAAQSPPFMTAGRIVVLREVGQLTAKDVDPIVAYLADPLDTTALVLVAGGGTVSPALVKALKTAGAQDHAPARGKPAEILAAALDDAPFTLRPDAARAVLERVGDELGRLAAIVEVLAVAFEPGSALSADDVAPYLGDEGSVPPWHLSRAIEDGDVPGALAVLQRLLGSSGPRQPKPMHPLQVLALLHNHYRRIARLDDPTIRTKADAAAALGGRVQEFQAQKALRQAQALGTDGLREAYSALARADLDLKGASGAPEDAVMAVLVARLAALSARSGTGGRGSRSGRSGSAARGGRAARG